MEIVKKVLDVFPGLKTNTACIGLLITGILQLLGVQSDLIEPTRKILLELLAYGLLMKNLRK